MVQNIMKIRQALMNIPDCIRPFPPGETFQGSDPAVKCIEMSSGSGNEEETDIAPSLKLEDDQLGSYKIEEFQPHFEIGADIDAVSPLFGGELGHLLKQSVLHKGIDAYGWYTSFHQTGVQWGVYISKTYLGFFIYHTLKNLQVPIFKKAEIAFKCVLNHELFHFATDYAVAQCEMFSDEAWWWPMKLAKGQNYNIQEEKLANAYMLQSSQRMRYGLKVKGKQEILRDFTKSQPVGYRDAVLVKRHDWPRELALLAHEYGKHAEFISDNIFLWDKKFGFDWAQIFPIRPQVNWRYCPIFLVDDAKKYGIPSGWLECLSCIPLIEESFSFREQLARLGQDNRDAWVRTKRRLQQTITRGADFKKWPPGGDDVYSVRINDNIRVHLKGVPRERKWLAIRIGNHKEMGHG